MNLRDLKIGVKQGIGFGIILILMGTISIFAVQQMADLRDDIEVVNQIWLQRVIIISDLNLNAAALRNAQLQYTFAPNETDREEQVGILLDFIDRIENNRDAYEEIVAEAQARDLYSTEEQALYRGFDLKWEQYLDHSLQLVMLLEENRRPQAISLITGPAQLVFEDFSTDLEGLVELNREGAAEAAVRAENTFQATRSVARLLLLLSALASTVIAFGLVRLITVPVRALVRAAGRVAQGDLGVQLYNQSADEIGTLSKSFNKMTNALRAASQETQRQQAVIERKNKDLETALKQLRTTQQQLVVREKMASLGQLTAGIAHEIKNPLNFVNNFAALSSELVDELQEALESRRHLPVEEALASVQELLQDLRFNSEKIEEHGKRADSIVRGMLEHSRGQSGQPVSTNLNTLLEEYLTLSYHGVRAQDINFQVTIKRDLASSLPLITVVQQDLSRVFLNLFSNAFYAVQERALRGEPGYEPMVSVRTRAQGGRVAIQVQDNGGGIPPALQERIFEPFFTTKPSGSGTGLGLSLSYDIITQGHGGRLYVESTPGEGATFFIDLPAS